MKRFFSFLTLLLGGMLFFGASGSASASYQLRILMEDVDSSGNVTSSHQLASSIETVNQNLTLSGGVGAYAVTVVTSFVSNGPTTGELDSSIVVKSNATTTDTLRVFVSATQYTLPTTPATLTSNSGSVT